MTGVISIDPGVSARGALGWGSFDRRTHTLLAAGLYRPEKGSKPWEIAFGAWLNLRSRVGAPVAPIVVIEEMRFYQKGNAPELIDLTATAALLAGLLRPCVVHYVPARDWKGQVPTELMAERVRAKLRADELAICHLACERDAPRAKSLHHNLYHGVGIGLHHLERLR